MKQTYQNTNQQSSIKNTLQKNTIKDYVQDIKQYSTLQKSPNYRRLKTSELIPIAINHKNLTEISETNDKLLLPPISRKKNKSALNMPNSLNSVFQEHLYLESLIKQQNILNNIRSLIETHGNPEGMIKILIKTKNEEIGKLQAQDSKLESIIRMSEIYCVISLMSMIILREHNPKALTNLYATIKQIIIHHHELILYLLQLIEESFSEKNIFPQKISEIKSIHESRFYKSDVKNKHHFIVATYKIKEILNDIIKNEPKFLSIFSPYIHIYYTNTVKLINQIVQLVNKTPKIQFSHELNTQKQYFLILDLDQTLVHYVDKKDHLLVRPYLYIFLKQLHKIYQLVVFTAASQTYADWVINNIDPQNLISKRLYRDSTILKSNYYIKDIEKVGYPLKKSIIIDNLQQNFSCNIRNGIKIRTWTGEKNDRVLRDLFPILKTLGLKSGQDIRQQLQKLKQIRKYNLIKNGFSF